HRLMTGGMLYALCPLLIASFAFALSSAPGRKRTAKANKPAIQPPKVVGVAGLIAVAQHQLELGNLEAAAQYAASASNKALILDDYAQYIRAQAEYGLKNYTEVAKAATQVFNQLPVSPLVGTAAALAVRADLDNDSPKQALELVKKYHE